MPSASVLTHVIKWINDYLCKCNKGCHRTYTFKNLIKYVFQFFEYRQYIKR